MLLLFIHIHFWCPKSPLTSKASWLLPFQDSEQKRFKVMDMVMLAFFFKLLSLRTQPTFRYPDPIPGITAHWKLRFSSTVLQHATRILSKSFCQVFLVFDFYISFRIYLQSLVCSNSHFYNTYYARIRAPMRSCPAVNVSSHWRVGAARV